MRRNSTEPVTPAVMSSDQTAQYLQISRSHLYRLVQTKRIPFVRMGGGTLSFRKTDIDSWLDAKTVQPVMARRRAS